MGSVKRQEFIQIDIRDAVTPGQHEGLVVDIWCQPFDATAGLSF